MKIHTFDLDQRRFECFCFKKRDICLSFFGCLHSIFRNSDIDIAMLPAGTYQLVVAGTSGQVVLPFVRL